MSTASTGVFFFFSSRRRHTRCGRDWSSDVCSSDLLALLAIAAAPAARAQMQPQTQGDVTFISGGIGDEWQQSMEALRAQYNLHLLFAQTGTGAYFANIPVQITDGSGRKVLDAVSQG